MLSEIILVPGTSPCIALLPFLQTVLFGPSIGHNFESLFPIRDPLAMDDSLGFGGCEDA